MRVAQNQAPDTEQHGKQGHKPRTPPNQPWIVLALFAVFVLAGMVRFWSAPSEDLSSSYVGCRLLATGHPGDLFSYDSENFADIGDSQWWKALGAAGGFHGYLHPYVQTPLWGYSLQPLCDNTSFAAFSRWFCLLIMLGFAGAIYLIARFWAPSLLRPGPIALTLLLFWFSEPFQYAMYLMQTHALFFFLSVAALILAERDRPIAAGALLALAAAVKVTPGILLFYWLFTRRWKAIGSLVLCSALLMLFTVLAVGPHLTADYLADLHRISRVLLVAQNNQSFAAWVMGRFYSSDEVFDINILPLPAALRIGSMALMIAVTALGGWLDRARPRLIPTLASPPVGAVMALLAVTVFAPIAWTHYFVILVAPVMLLAQLALRLRSWSLAALALAITVLNFRPFASDVIRMDIGDLALVRGQFYAGVLALASLALAVWFERARALRHPTALDTGVVVH